MRRRFAALRRVGQNHGDGLSGSDGAEGRQSAAVHDGSGVQGQGAGVVDPYAQAARLPFGAHSQGRRGHALQREGPQRPGSEVDVTDGGRFSGADFQGLAGRSGAAREGVAHHRFGLLQRQGVTAAVHGKQPDRAAQAGVTGAGQHFQGRQIKGQGRAVQAVLRQQAVARGAERQEQQRHGEAGGSGARSAPFDEPEEAAEDAAVGGQEYAEGDVRRVEQDRTRQDFHRRVPLIQEAEFGEHAAEVDAFGGLQHVVPQGLVAAPAGQGSGGVIDRQKHDPAVAEGALRQQRRVRAADQHLTLRQARLHGDERRRLLRHVVMCRQFGQTVALFHAEHLHRQQRLQARLREQGDARITGHHQGAAAGDPLPQRLRL